MPTPSWQTKDKRMMAVDSLSPLSKFLSAMVVPLLVAGCGGSGSAGGSAGSGGSGGSDNREPVVSCADVANPDEFFPPQEFADDFDCGRAGNRWIGPWEVVAAGALDPYAEPPEVPGPGQQGSENYVFQSPDPLLSESFRGLSCTGFPAEFAEEGTFAFNYFVKTAQPIAGVPFSGNRLEVSVYSNTLDSEGFPIDSQRENVLTVDGSVSSRFSTTLPAGYYDFEFCYVRDRIADVSGPDFVQIDDVDTCAGTGCQGEVPVFARCRVDQGQTLVPSLGTLPTPTFEFNRVQGTDDRYYLIVDLDFLDFISGGLEALQGERYDAIKAEVDGLRMQTLVDGETCEIDTRKSLLIEMSDDEFLDFLLETGLLEEALDELEQALIEGATQALVDAALDKIEQKIGEQVAKFLGKMLGKLIAAAI
jgi:hypothetical protein